MLNIKVLVIIGVLCAAAAAVGTVFVVFQPHEDPLAGELLKRLDAKEKEQAAAKAWVDEMGRRDEEAMRRNAGIR